jgi:hypothetical protein
LSDDFYKIIKDAGEAVLKKKLPTPETLVDHLQSVALITHINMTAENKNLKKDYTSIFKNAFFTFKRTYVVGDIGSNMLLLPMSLTSF